MKFAMYEVIELYRAPYGVRANVAVKILLLSLIAIPSNTTQHARLIQRLNFWLGKMDLCISLLFSLDAFHFLQMRELTMMRYPTGFIWHHNELKFNQEEMLPYKPDSGKILKIWKYRNSHHYYKNGNTVTLEVRTFCIKGYTYRGDVLPLF